MMDGLTLLAIVHELKTLIGGRVEKVQQPEQDTLLLTIRAGGSNYKLLLCAHAQNGRVQLTQMSYSNPMEPPMFCMLLRKRLHGARITRIEQPSLDRVLHIEFEARDELGFSADLKLILELMGKHSNICFVNDKGVLIDSIKHVSAGMSSVRILLPGVKYIEPPKQEKLNPLEANAEQFYDALNRCGVVYKLISERFFGLSPHMAKQIISRWAGEDALLSESLSEKEKRALSVYLQRRYASFGEGKFSPGILVNDLNEPVAAYAFEPAAALQSITAYASMSEALDAFYEKRDAAESFRRKSASLQKKLQNQLERAYKKLALYEAALHQDENLEQYRLFGELIMANLHVLKRGDTLAKLSNYYHDPPQEIAVPLLETLSPQQNAQRNFKLYQKGKAAKRLAQEQCARTREDVEYLEGQLDNLNKCTKDVELLEIRQELIREGYIKPEQRKGAQQKQKPSKPMQLLSSEQIPIYIGKNNTQNDMLTLRLARSEDWWFHTKNIPGSHVIVPGEADVELSLATLREAALAAAYYSKARTSASVPVDYCRRKFVKKPAGAKPGMVIYTTNRTIYITPDEAALKALAMVGE